jgi:hypothetical protein
LWKQKRGVHLIHLNGDRQRSRSDSLKTLKR